jgi:uncharacterized membrane protein
MNTTDADDSNALPFVAPCRSLKSSAPLHWLRLGWQDLLRAPIPSLSIGITIALLSMGLSWLGYTMGGYWVEMVWLSGFVFVGPLLAVGLYATSRELAQGRQPTFGISLREMQRDFSTLMVFALVLLVVFLVWARAATVIHVFMPDIGDATWREYFPFLSVGIAVGAVFAAITFAASAFSLPMIMDKKSDAVTAVVSSIHAVLRNKGAMLVWSALIVAGLLLGFATFMLGLAVIVPVIGHASWHGYREIIDASAWPDNVGNLV